MIKVKFTKNGTYSIKGMDSLHMEALYTLLANTRLGDGVYEEVVYELVEAIDESDDTATLGIEDCELSVESVGGCPTIILTHTDD